MSRSCCSSRTSHRRVYRPFGAPRRGRSQLALALAILVVAAAVALLSSGCAAKPASAAPDEVAAAIAALGPEPYSGPVVSAKTAPPDVATAIDGRVRLPVSAQSGTTAHFYTYTAGKQVIPFFVVRSADGVIRAAFDACDVCFEAHLGFRQEGDEMVCNNCGARFPTDQVNEVQGDCNPSPLARVIEGDAIVIDEQALLAGLPLFVSE